MTGAVDRDIPGAVGEPAQGLPGRDEEEIVASHDLKLERLFDASPGRAVAARVTDRS
jgi:hypothetical protein